jgi:nucleoside 2-deoxyribosyltransferase
MKIALSYKFTGEDYNKLKEFLDRISESLKEEGHQVFGTYLKKKEFEKNKTSLKEIMLTELGYIDDSDYHLIIINSQEKSEGLCIEFGYSFAKDKKIILAMKKGIKYQWIPKLATKTIEFEDTEDLCKKLKKVKF